MGGAEAFWCMLAMAMGGGRGLIARYGWLWLEADLARIVMCKNPGGGSDVRRHHCR
jgi:hypothetical protein